MDKVLSCRAPTWTIPSRRPPKPPRSCNHSCLRQQRPHGGDLWRLAGLDLPARERPGRPTVGAAAEEDQAVASVKAAWIVASAVDGAAVVIGHLPAGLRPERLGQPQVPAIERNSKVGLVGRSRHVTAARISNDDRPREKCSSTPNPRG